MSDDFEAAMLAQAMRWQLNGLTRRQFSFALTANKKQWRALAEEYKNGYFRTLGNGIGDSVAIAMVAALTDAEQKAQETPDHD